MKKILFNNYKKIHSILCQIFLGILIGAGAILPGISSGVLCVIFGIYETILNCILNFFKNISFNLKFLLPLSFGIFIGIFIFGNIINFIFYSYPIQTKSFFIGLILGEIPPLIKRTFSNCSLKKVDFIFLILSFLSGLLLVYIENTIILLPPKNNFNFTFIIFSGFIMSLGIVVPGISSTLILMILGVYDSYILSVSTLYLPFLIPLSIGIIFGCFICMKLINYLLHKYYSKIFLCIIGFTLGSIFILYPGFSFDINGLISILCFILGLSISSTLK